MFCIQSCDWYVWCCIRICPKHAPLKVFLDQPSHDENIYDVLDVLLSRFWICCVVFFVTVLWCHDWIIHISAMLIFLGNTLYVLPPALGHHFIWSAAEPFTSNTIHMILKLQQHLCVQPLISQLHDDLI